ncbi:hypothetical protein SKAU_G00173450 [Synaphobranchus kaupii]|uniref:Uncharacterized protein n=1 Tax=Synaphobranchus kaupii TaxID=118154 RepID=A0A9Q1FKV9_SYNKA|nr:hypothetical protein SKAU_G00173450 [Synaphobranchus kaupii]
MATNSLNRNGKKCEIVQTSRGRLAGASPVTSAIHTIPDGCQPGAARAVSMETTNNRLTLPPFTCAAQTMRTNWLQESSFIYHLKPSL